MYNNEFDIMICTAVDCTHHTEVGIAGRKCALSKPFMYMTWKDWFQSKHKYIASYWGEVSLECNKYIDLVYLERGISV